MADNQVVAIQMFVDKGLGHSSYLIDLGDATTAILDPPRFAPTTSPPPSPARRRRGGRSTRTLMPTT